MKQFLTAGMLVLAFFVAQAAQAAGHGTPDEAKAMAIKAAAFLKANGPDKAFPAFDSDPAWHDRDLYVFVQDNNGKVLAHGTNPALIGKTLINLKDVDGKPFVQEMVAVKDQGWVDYKWQNPETKTIEPKTSYVIRIGDDTVGVGAYKNQ
jgi:cytochrome c